MKTGFGLLFIASSVCISMLMFNGCTKKITKVEPVLEVTPAPVPIPASTPVPVPFDSSAIIQAQIREALRNIYFDLDKCNLRQDAIDQLGSIAKILFTRNTVSISIEGNCDDRGSSEYNMGLGELRAKAVKKWLVAYGISDTRLLVTSYGKERLAAYNCSDESCHQQNRRCEFKVVSF